jgi:hypothetical protein
MTERTLYLHIGTEKTGTTSVQEFFHQHRSQMEERHSILYPKFGYAKLAQFELVAAIHPMSNGGRKAEFAPNFDYDPSEVWGRFCAQILGSDCRKVFVSVEHFSSRLSEVGIRFISEYLKENLPGFKVVVLIYLRNQVDMLQSAYSTYIKTGGTKSIFEIADGINGGGIYYNYFNLISLWAKYFGSKSIVARNFNLLDRSKGVVGDVLEILGVEHEGYELDSKSNETWNPVFLEFCRLLNAGDLSGVSYGKRYEAYASLLERYESFAEFDGFSLLPSQSVDRLLGLFKESNIELNLLLNEQRTDYFPAWVSKKPSYDYSNFSHDLSRVLFASSKVL